MSEHPDQRAKVVADRSLVNNTIEELLRYEAPSPVQARYIQEDVEHHGQKITAGNVMNSCSPRPTSRDERHFPDAERFDIRARSITTCRSGMASTSASAALARLEGRIALDEVLSRLPEWEVDWDRAERAHTSFVLVAGAPRRRP